MEIQFPIGLLRNCILLSLGNIIRRSVSLWLFRGQMDYQKFHRLNQANNDRHRELGIPAFIPVSFWMKCMISLRLEKW
jgi:hypothetical protein